MPYKIFCCYCLNDSKVMIVHVQIWTGGADSMAFYNGYVTIDIFVHERRYPCFLPILEPPFEYLCDRGMLSLLMSKAPLASSLNGIGRARLCRI
jgi:hypothetical protein